MKVVSGVVIEGKKKGRELGFPTANIILAEPMEGGIYAGRTTIEGEDYPGAIFIYPGGNLFEIHILDFDGDLYGQFLTVEIGAKIRDFKKIDNEEDLKKQIADDVRRVRFLHSLS
jgi:riboflavin kinase/FMN adenylyltransferase